MVSFLTTLTVQYIKLTANSLAAYRDLTNAPQIFFQPFRFKTEINHKAILCANEIEIANANRMDERTKIFT